MKVTRRNLIKMLSYTVPALSSRECGIGSGEPGDATGGATSSH